QVQNDQEDSLSGNKTPDVPEGTASTEATEDKISKQLEVKLEPSARGRVNYWKQAINVVQEDGLMAIIGRGEVDLVAKFEGLVTHSLLLQNIVLYGLVGLQVFIITWIAFAYISWSWIRKIKTEIQIIAI